MKALVTGGAGFIGSHVADRLLEKGYHVRVVDSLQPRVHRTGKPVWLSPEIEFVRGDVRDKGVMRRALQGVELVSHHAAYQDYMPDFSTFVSTNATSMALILELIVEMRLTVRKIVVASSQAVYGEGCYVCPEHGRFRAGPRRLQRLERAQWEVGCPACDRDCDVLPLDEHMHNPNNAYALSKLFEEMTALRLGQLHGIPAAAARYSITQGPRQSPHNGYSGICRIFAQRIRHGESPVVYEDGLQRRDYVHVEDVVNANMILLFDDRTNFEAYNVGSGRATTVLEYAHQVADLMRSEVTPVVTGEFRVGDNRHSVSSIDKLAALGWAPRRTLRDILLDYLNWLDGCGQVSTSYREADRRMRASGSVLSVRR